MQSFIFTNINVKTIFFVKIGSQHAELSLALLSTQKFYGQSFLKFYEILY